MLGFTCLGWLRLAQEQFGIQDSVGIHCPTSFPSAPPPRALGLTPYQGGSEKGECLTIVLFCPARKYNSQQILDIVLILRILRLLRVIVSIQRYK